jgi:two-component system OmpR family response regulator
MDVLFVEDDDLIALPTIRDLERAGFSVHREVDGESGYRTGKSGRFEGIVLDLTLPRQDGLTTLKEWRAAGVRTPVLILSARGTWMERVEGIEAGADDYLPKPFHIEELVARLRAFQRRGPAKGGNTETVELDEARKTLRASGKEIPLTPRELKTVAYLLANRDRVVSAEEIIAHLHGDEATVTANAVEAMIGRLRRKLDTDLIETRRGFGYLVRS